MPLFLSEKMTDMDMKQYLAEKREIFGQALLKSMEKWECVAPELCEAMKYSLLAGGKRIRPVLAMAACEACGGDVDAVMPFAVALEYIHTYSLIHDDLPAMDDDDLRRGMPTNHKKFGEATAILAGDALLTEAFKIIAEGDFPADSVKVEGIKVLASAAGEGGMVGGQKLDLDFEGKVFGKDELFKIHLHKTGKLIAAAAELGAVAAGAGDVYRGALRKYGEAIGLAFQLRDDLLDVESSGAIGKDSGSDAKNQKATALALLGREGAAKELKIQIDTAVEALRTIDGYTEPLAALAVYIGERSN